MRVLLLLLLCSPCLAQDAPPSRTPWTNEVERREWVVANRFQRAYAAAERRRMRIEQSSYGQGAYGQAVAYPVYIPYAPVYIIPVPYGGYNGNW